MDLKQAADSSLAKISARFVMPVLIFVLTLAVSIIGFFLVQTSSRIESTQSKQALTQLEQGKDIAAIRSDVRDVNTRLDAQVIRQVDQNTQGFNDLRKRVEVIERTVRVP